MKEPILRKEDAYIWASWKKICLLHARTDQFKIAVSRARQHVFRMYDQCPQAYLAWSAGKDSTVMTHLIGIECKLPAQAMSIKDDCDFPGEERYLRKLANRWEIEVDIVRPLESVQESAMKHQIQVGEDIHSRKTPFSKSNFYDLIRKYRLSKETPGVYLGLRSSESNARKLNLETHGYVYTKKNGETVCQPIAHWTDLDVFAYLFSRNIEPFDVYKCCRLHTSPGKVRKSWWLIGVSALHGENIWLKTYWPKLFRRLCVIVHGACRVA